MIALEIIHLGIFEIVNFQVLLFKVGFFATILLFTQKILVLEIKIKLKTFY